MEVKKKLFNRIGAFVCALVVLVGCLGGATNYYADSTNPYVLALKSHLDEIINHSVAEKYSYLYEDLLETEPYCVIVCTRNEGYLYKASFSQEPWLVLKTDKYGNIFNNWAYSGTCSTRHVNFSADELEWSSGMGFGSASFGYLTPQGALNFNGNHYMIVASNFDIKFEDGTVLYSPNETSFDSTIGYLQDVKLTNAYTSGVLGNYDNDSLTRRWKFSQYTTTGVDLLNGDYLVRHYIKPVGVSGYEKEDIKQEFDMYLMGEYEASPLYFKYLQKDYDAILEAQGYDGLGFAEMYLKGWFILYHHYFQLVDNATGKVGGYVHIYPYDANGENFGVEYIGETLDEDMNLDEDGYSGVVNESEIGTGETIEDAFENAKPESERGIDFSGVDEFADVLESYVGQVSNVTQGVGAMLNSLPPWLLVTLAIGISLTVFLGVIKIIRG